MELNVWEADDGWHWQLTGETESYGCEIAGGGPCASREEAEMQAIEKWARLWIEMQVRVCPVFHPEEPATTYDPPFVDPSWEKDRVKALAILGVDRACDIALTEHIRRYSHD